MSINSAFAASIRLPESSNELLPTGLAGRTACQIAGYAEMLAMAGLEYLLQIEPQLVGWTHAPPRAKRAKTDVSCF